jgi:hypothetical protein
MGCIPNVIIGDIIGMVRCSGVGSTIRRMRKELEKGGKVLQKYGAIKKVLES